MAQAAEKQRNQLPRNPVSVPNTATFERELTELSRKHSIGLAGSITLFVMEPDDFERHYRSNDQSQLHFV